MQRPNCNFRPMPWLAKLIDNYATENNVDRTDAIHGVVQDFIDLSDTLADMVEIAEKQQSRLTTVFHEVEHKWLICEAKLHG